MSEYKRLTQWTENGASLDLGDPKSDVEARQALMVQFKKACNKLAELEDKIEAGTLVELPCRVMIERTLNDKGDFINTKKAQAFNGRYGILYIDKQKCTVPLIDICTEKAFNREAAEARLKELEEKVNELYSNNCR